MVQKGRPTTTAAAAASSSGRVMKLRTAASIKSSSSRTVGAAAAAAFVVLGVATSTISTWTSTTPTTRPTAVAAFTSTSTTTTRTTASGSISGSSSRRYMTNNNPLNSLMSGVASSLFGGSGPSTPNQGLDVAIQNMDSTTIPSWTDLASSLQEKQTPQEQSFREHVASGRVASPLNKIRLFEEGQTEDDIQVTFYRDSASWCPYCQKVWLTLEYKQIPYRVEKINMRCYGDKPSSFLRIQPGGQIPVAIINGEVYGQSNDILMALEDQFPSNSKKTAANKLMPDPKDAKSLAKAQELFSLERQLFSAWMGWLTGRGGNQRQSFERTLEYVDHVLQQQQQDGGPFFLGPDLSMVDVQFSSFLERMVSSLLYFKGFEMRVPKDDPRRRSSTLYPGINNWFDAMERLEAYQLTKSDHYTHAHDLPPQLGGCTSERGSERFQDAIDGLDGQSWKLPLEPHLGGLEPDWEWAGSNDDGAAWREAAERLSFNHESIVKFACRGAGQRGMPPVSAPLADPNAQPNEAVQTSVDACLRVVCRTLLHYDDDTNKNVSGEKGVTGDDERSMRILAEKIKSDGGSEYSQGVTDSLAYLRDRIGVPRDMRLPAARQLRAHLNWAIDTISSI